MTNSLILKRCKTSYDFLVYIKLLIISILVPVDILYEVRAGKNTTIFKEQGSAYSEDCCFSLICGPNYDSIDLVAKTSEEASIWITGMRLLLTHHLG